MKRLGLWVFCLLFFSCTTVSAIEPGTEPGGPAAPLETPTPAGIEAAREEEVPSVNWIDEAPAEREELPDVEPEFAAASAAASREDLPNEEETPEIMLPMPFPAGFSLEASNEAAALPEPVFPEPEEAPETVAAPVPAPRPPDSEPLVLDPPPVLDTIALPEPVFPEPEEAPETVAAPIPVPRPPDSEPLILDPPPVLDTILEPAPELVQVPPPGPANPPAQPPPPTPSSALPSELVQVRPSAPVNPSPPAQSPPSNPSPPPVPPSEPATRPRPVEPSSGIGREPLPLPAAPVSNLPAREPPAPPAPSPSEAEIEYSRIVRAAVGQIIEIPFQGAGWVYLGELRSRLGVAYNSRRSDPEGQTFIFRAEEPGTFGLKFYKQDYVRDYILNDYVQVIVDETPVRELFAPSRDPIRVISAPRRPYLPGEEPAAEAAGITDRAGDSRTEDASVATAVPSGKAEAPQTPPVQTPGPADRDDDSIVPAAPPRSPTGDQAAAGDQPIEDGGSALPEEDMLPEDYFRKAREAFEGGQIQPALVILDQFRERYPLGSDEAWWLYGQFLEAAGPARNIRLALDYYRRLVRDYPQSPRYNDARGRIAYLERFYFNIR